MKRALARMLALRSIPLINFLTNQFAEGILSAIKLTQPSRE
jgi:hypothetical protein